MIFFFSFAAANASFNFRSLKGSSALAVMAIRPSIIVKSRIFFIIKFFPAALLAAPKLSLLARSYPDRTPVFLRPYS
jgi:hypothetical protein